MDLPSCANERCQIEIVAGKPHWSPDGGQMLIQERPIPTRITDANPDPYDTFQRPLLRGDGTGQAMMAVSTGYAPVWLDNSHYGYLRLNDARVPEWTVASVTDDEPQVALEAQDLVTAVPPSARPAQLFMRDTLATSPNQIAIIATTDLLTGTLEYVFLWDRLNAPRLVESGEGLQVAFSPDGRYLTIIEANGTVSLTHTGTGQQQQFHSPQASPDWTADSQWLLTSYPNHLLLTNLEGDYEQIVLHDNSACQQINWGQ